MSKLINFEETWLVNTNLTKEDFYNVANFTLQIASDLLHFWLTFSSNNVKKGQTL